MADIAKPQIGKRGWNTAVDAAIDKVNAHDANPLVTATVTTTGAAVGSLLVPTAVSGGVPTAHGYRDGTMVGDPADVGYDVILLIGQSNMSGRGAAYDTVRLDPPTERIQQYGASGAYANIISQAVEPLAMLDTPTGIGPGFAFARWYLQAVPQTRRVLLVPAALGGTAFESGTNRWKVGYAPAENNLYERAITQTQAALAAAGPNSRLVAALWLQGETDGNQSVAGSTYAADLDALIAGLRSRLGVAGLPFVIGQMIPEFLPTGTRAAINTAHLQTPSRVTRAAVALGPINQNNGDDLHYNAPGQRIMGRRMFDAYRRIITATADPAIPSVPGQVTGLSAAAAVGSAPLTWAAVTGASVYYVEYKLTADSNWILGPTPTTNSVTVTGLANAAAYDYRVRAINAAGPGTVSATASATTGTPEPTITNVVGVSSIGAYGLRRLVDTYAGPLVKVRRSSDSTSLDIGMDAAGDLDTAALTAFVGAGSGYVGTLYDQSASVRHLTQAATSAQPRIVNAGTVDAVAGRPTMVFDGTDDVLFTSTPGLYAAGAASALAVLSGAAPTATKRLLCEASSASATPTYTPMMNAASGGVATQFVRNDANTTLVATTGTGAAPLTGAAHQWSMVDTATALSHWVDGGAGQTTAYARSGTITVDRLALGAVVNSSGTTGALAASISEIVLFGAALTTPQRQTGEANQKARFGTP